MEERMWERNNVDKREKQKAGRNKVVVLLFCVNILMYVHVYEEGVRNDGLRVKNGKRCRKKVGEKEEEEKGKKKVE